MLLGRTVNLYIWNLYFVIICGITMINNFIAGVSTVTPRNCKSEASCKFCYSICTLLSSTIVILYPSSVFYSPMNMSFLRFRIVRVVGLSILVVNVVSLPVIVVLPFVLFIVSFMSSLAQEIKPIDKDAIAKKIIIWYSL